MFQNVFSEKHLFHPPELINSLNKLSISKIANDPVSTAKSQTLTIEKIAYT